MSDDLIMCDPDREFGEPFFILSGVPVKVVLDRLRAAESVHSVVEDLGLTPDEVELCQKLLSGEIERLIQKNEALRTYAVRDVKPETNLNKDRILWNHRPENSSDMGEVDEIVCHDVTVHVEQMNEICWWIGIYGDKNRHWSGNFVAEDDGTMRFYLQEDDWVWARDESHEEFGESESE